MKIIYMDHAATTKTDKEVLKSMLPYFSEEFGNPNAIYSLGRNAKKAIEKSRSTIADLLNCDFDEVIFTGSGTESDNLAIFGTVASITKSLGSNVKPENLHVITTAIEHGAVLNPFKNLERQGYRVTYLKPDKKGLITTENLKNALTPETVFVSIIYANNEIGTIAPIKELAQTAHLHKNTFKKPLVFHTDACQAAGALSIDTRELGIDLLTLNGSKIYGPKGIGILYKKSGTPISPQILGGGQEFGIRSGTENVPLIVGMAKALSMAQASRKKESSRLKTLRDKLIKGIQEKIPRTYLNGHATERLPNNANILILDIEGEALLLHLDDAGIAVSTGSACDSRSLEPSHVLLALGLPKEAVHGSVRFTLGKETTEKDINHVIEILPKIVEKLRKISPIHLDEKKLDL